MDYIITEAMARETAQSYSASELRILETVGHSVIIEDPGLFRKLVASFLRNIKQ